MDTDPVRDYEGGVLEAPTPQRLEEALGRIAHLEATLAKVTDERDKLRRAYEQLKEHLELLRRRIFFAKAERIDVAQLEIEFAQTQAKLVALVQHLAEQTPPPPATDSENHLEGPPPAKKTRAKPTGRRNLADEDLPEERVEILDPALEGEAERIGFEESCKLRYRRGGPVRSGRRAGDLQGRAAERRAESRSPWSSWSRPPCPRSCSRAGCSLPR